MVETMKFHDSVIMTIPVLSYINNEMILGEIGNIHRFSSPSKLLAFAGLDPSVCQSSNYRARQSRMPKHGSRVLRYALINAAHNVVKNNATFKTYYTKNCKKPDSLQCHRTLCRQIRHVRVIWKMLLTKSNLTSTKRPVYQYR